MIVSFLDDLVLALIFYCLGFKFVGKESGFCSKVSNSLTSIKFLKLFKGVEESKQRVLYHDNRIMIAGVKINMSSLPLREPKVALILFIPVVFGSYWFDELRLRYSSKLSHVFVFPVVIL